MPVWLTFWGRIFTGIVAIVVAFIDKPANPERPPKPTRLTVEDHGFRESDRYLASTNSV